MESVEKHDTKILAVAGKGGVGKTSIAANIVRLLVKNHPGTFSVRLRAPRTGSMEMATYYMTSFLCEYTRHRLEWLEMKRKSK